MSANAPSVVFLTPEALHTDPLGPARRTIKLAEAVAEHCRVTLAAPRGSVFPPGPFETVESGPPGDPDLARALTGHDVAVVQTLPSPRLLLAVRRHAPRLVIDMVAPLALEAAELASNGGGRGAVTRWRAREQMAHLALADLVLCTNERQRDLAVGAALAADALTRDASPVPVAERIAVVPHGVDEEPAPSGRSPLREAGVVAEGTRLALWAGGMWGWLDPLTAIRAVERLRPARPDLKLAFVAFEHPDPVQRAAHQDVVAEAVRYVSDRELQDAVVLRAPWLPRDAYVDHIREADVGVSLHRPTLEARFATRTRVLDYLSGGLPVVCTAGDTMSELVARHDLGAVVRPRDVADCAEALDRLTRLGHTKVDADAVLEGFRWRNVARPLVDFCLDPGPQRGPSAARALAITARGYAAFVNSVYHSEPGALPRAVARSARRVLGQA